MFFSLSLRPLSSGKSGKREVRARASFHRCRFSTPLVSSAARSSDTRSVVPLPDRPTRLTPQEEDQPCRHRTEADDQTRKGTRRQPPIRKTKEGETSRRPRLGTLDLFYVFGACLFFPDENDPTGIIDRRKTFHWRSPSEKKREGKEKRKEDGKTALSALDLDLHIYVLPTHLHMRTCMRRQGRRMMMLRPRIKRIRDTLSIHPRLVPSFLPFPRGTDRWKPGGGRPRRINRPLLPNPLA